LDIGGHLGPQQLTLRATDHTAICPDTWDQQALGHLGAAAAPETDYNLSADGSVAKIAAGHDPAAPALERLPLHHRRLSSRQTLQQSRPLDRLRI